MIDFSLLVSVCIDCYPTEAGNNAMCGDAQYRVCRYDVCSFMFARVEHKLIQAWRFFRHCVFCVWRPGAARHSVMRPGIGVACSFFWPQPSPLVFKSLAKTLSHGNDIWPRDAPLRNAQTFLIGCKPGEFGL